MKRYGFGLLLILAALSACARPAPTPTPRPAPLLAGAPEPSPSPRPATPAPVRIIFWHTERDDERRGQLLHDMAERFHGRYPWITVEPVYVGASADLLKKARAAVAAGHPPDLALVSGSDIAELMSTRAVVPLEPYIDDREIGLTAEDRDDFFPDYWQANVFSEFGNQMLSFPLAQEAVALYYNRTALAAAGIPGPPKTWQDFEQACLAVNKSAKGAVRGYACHEDATTFEAWLYSRGGELLSFDRSKATLNGPQGVAALELLNRLLRAGAASRPEGLGADRLQFAQGKAAFTIGPTGDIPYYAEAIAKAGTKMEWGCTVIPREGLDKPRTVLLGANLCLLATGEDRERAGWLFIRWLTATDQAAEWSMVTGYAPLRRSALARLADSGWLAANPASKEAFETALPYARPEPHVRGWLAIRTIIADAVATSAGGLEVPQDALDDAAVRVDEVLATR